MPKMVQQDACTDVVTFDARRPEEQDELVPDVADDDFAAITALVEALEAKATRLRAIFVDELKVLDEDIQQQLAGEGGTE